MKRREVVEYLPLTLIQHILTYNDSQKLAYLVLTCSKAMFRNLRVSPWCFEHVVFRAMGSNPTITIPQPFVVQFYINTPLVYLPDSGIPLPKLKHTWKKTYFRTKGVVEQDGIWVIDANNHFSGTWTGFGTLFWKSGKPRYVGGWERGERTGRGKVYDKEGGLYYDANWVLGKKFGQGREYDKTGQLKYCGEWARNLKEGYGKEFGDHRLVLYEGNFRLGERHGQGTLFSIKRSWISGHYTGEFKDGFKNGKGRQYHQDGSLKYDGTWRHDLKEGVFTVYYPTTTTRLYEGPFDPKAQPGGVRYKGEFSDDNRHGLGQSFFPNGSVEFDGEWRNGNRHGRGRSFFPNRSLRFEGEWFFGKEVLNGVVRRFRDDGSLEFKGVYDSGVRHGEGKEFYTNGNVESEGEWFLGRKNGAFKLYREDGSLWYVGDFRNNVRHGPGRAFEEDGKTFHEEEWQKGRRIRQSISSIL